MCELRYSNEISSLKLTLDLVRVENLHFTHQVNSKTDNKWLNVDHDLRSINSSPQAMMMHSPHNISHQDQFAVPTSNHYAALATYTEHQLNKSSLNTHPIPKSRKLSRNNTNYSKKPHRERFLQRTCIKSTPSQHMDNHNLH